MSPLQLAGSHTGPQLLFIYYAESAEQYTKPKRHAYSTVERKQYTKIKQ